jgi:hypothetical protein
MGNLEQQLTQDYVPVIRHVQVVHKNSHPMS